MTLMRTLLRARLWLATAVVAVIAMSASACGNADDSSSGSSEPSAESPVDRPFPLLRVTWGPPDFIDPAVTWTFSGWGITWNTHLGLVAFPHTSGDGSIELVPAVAEDLPTISKDERKYTFTIRRGLKYSNGTPVHASDFEFTFKRAFTVDTPNSVQFIGVVGAERFLRTKQGDIPGIVTNDKSRTVEITLEEPRADFLYGLATPWMSFVPPDTPMKVQTKPIPGVGAYRMVGYEPNRSFELERNPFFDPVEGVPAGNPARVEARIEKNPEVSLESVLNGDSDYDFNQPPIDRLEELQSKYPDQVKLYTIPNTLMWFLNQRIAPFDDLQVRRAVQYAIDRDAIVRLYGGLAKPTQNLIPDAFDSYQEISEYSYDLEKARQLVREAGAEGEPVTVWSDDSEQGRKVNTYLVDQLDAIGLDAKLKVLSESVYFDVVGEQETNAQVVWSGAFFVDYPHPLARFDPVLNGNNIVPVNNYNFGYVDYPDVNRELESLASETTLTPELNERWAELDRLLVVDRAAVVPGGEQTFVDFFGPEIEPACYINSRIYGWDFSTTCLK